MNKKQSDILKYLASISVAAVLMYYCFRQLNWTDFWSGLKACRWEYIILSMLLGVLSFYFRALRWRELLLPIDSSTSRLTAFNAINISYLVNMILPRVGELARCGVITAHSRRDPDAKPGENQRLASYDKVLGTAVLGRSSDVFMLGLLLVLFLLFTWNRFGGFFVEKIFGQASGRLSAGTLLILAALIVTAALMVWIPIRFSHKWKPFEKVADFIKGIWKGAISCFKMKQAWKFFVLTLLIWGCYWMMSLTILWALQGMNIDSVSPQLASAVSKLSDLNAIDALFLMLAGSISSIVPVPGGFGAFHYIVASAISTVYGTPFHFGMLFATLSHESQAIAQLVSGAFSALGETIRKRTATND